MIAPDSETMPQARNEIVVSLTTINSRLGLVDGVIRSLLSQSLRPDKVVLYVSRDPYLLDAGVNEDDLTEPLRTWRNTGELHIEWTPNIGPYRKLLPALHERRDDTVLIATADDDVYYPQDWLGGLYSAYLESGTICAYRCRRMATTGQGFLPYSRWDLIHGGELDALHSSRACRLDILPTGRGGILYPSRVFHDLKMFADLIALAPTNDDLGIRFATLLSAAPVRVVRHGLPTEAKIEFDGFDSGPILWHINRRDNDKMLADLLRYSLRNDLLNQSVVRTLWPDLAN